MSNEHMIGVLHAFVLLKPTIDKALKNTGQIEDSMKFMHQHGYPTHQLANKKFYGNNPNIFIPTDSVPVINRDDATKFLEMEFKTAKVGDSMRNVFLQVKAGMDKINLVMPSMPESGSLEQYADSARLIRRREEDGATVPDNL